MLGQAWAAMTMDLYGPLIDQNLWASAKRVGGIPGASESVDDQDETLGKSGQGL